MAPFFTIPKLCLYTQDESPLFKKKKKKQERPLSAYTLVSAWKLFQATGNRKKKKQRKTKKKKKEPNTVYKQIEGGNKEKKEIKLGGLKTNSDASCEPASPALVKVKQKKKKPQRTHEFKLRLWNIYTREKEEHVSRVTDIYLHAWTVWVQLVVPTHVHAYK